MNFYLNQKEIAAIECENKDRPEMNCNGKCYLAKQLEKADARVVHAFKLVGIVRDIKLKQLVNAFSNVVQLF
jgi:uncharacterized protein YlzI (FlbEa/FlbD family)